MTIALVQSNTVQISGVNTANLSFPSGVTAGNCVVACVSSWANATSSATDNQSGNSYASLVSRDDGAFTGKVAVWGALNVNASGTFTVTVNFAGNADATITIGEFSGVATSSAAEVANSATGSGTSPSVSTNGATTDAGDVVIAVVTQEGSTTSITEAGSLIGENENNSTSQCGNAQYTLPGATGTQTLTWTLGASAVWRAAVVALKPSGGAAAAASRMMNLGMG